MTLISVHEQCINHRDIYDLSRKAADYEKDVELQMTHQFWAKWTLKYLFSWLTKLTCFQKTVCLADGSNLGSYSVK